MNELVSIDIINKFNVKEDAVFDMNRIESIKELYHKAKEVINIVDKNDDISKYVFKRFIEPYNTIMRLYNIRCTEEVITIRKSNKEPLFVIYEHSLFYNPMVDSEYVSNSLISFDFYLSRILEFVDYHHSLMIVKDFSKESMINFLKKYPYVKISHTLFEDCYIYSKGERNKYLIYDEVYDENDKLFEDWKVSVILKDDIPTTYQSEYRGIRNMTESHWDNGWYVVGFMKDEEGNIL